MLSARSALKAEYGRTHRAMLAIARDDAVCRRLMTVPGVGPLVLLPKNRRFMIVIAS